MPDRDARGQRLAAAGTISLAGITMTARPLQPSTTAVPRAAMAPAAA
jgi:hypothetical protein